MTFVRNLAADLVAKRLWPVAAVLAVALVAIPVLLAQGAEEPPAMPAIAAPPATGAQAAVGVADERPRGGRGPIGRNPFAQKRLGGSGAARAAGVTESFAPATPAPATGAAAAGAVTGGAAGVPVPAGGEGPGDVSPGPVPGLDDALPAGGDTDRPAGDDKRDARTRWNVDLRIGRDGQNSRRTDVAGLTPLPSADDPVVVFLGVAAEGRTARFLVSSGAEATGGGTCRPTAASCKRVELREGDTETFEVTTPEGQTVRYRLEVTDIARRTKADGGARATSARSRLGGFRVDLRSGLTLSRPARLAAAGISSLVFLGVRSDGRTAVFLNPTEAATRGDGVCLPSPEECGRIELRAGQRGVVATPAPDGRVEEHEIAVDAVNRLRR